MKLSIIVPVYNMAGEGKLNYCLDSLLAQVRADGTPLPDYEILAVDDCSTDSSWQVLQAYAERHPDRLRIFRTPRNLHQGGAKNLALEHIRGDWLAFIDADDWVSASYFARLLDRAAGTGADCVGCDYSLVHSHTMEPGQRVANSRQEQAGVLDDSAEGLTRRRSLMVDFGSLCVKIYRKELILDCPSRFPEDMFYEDNALARTWISRMHHFEYIPEPLYYYYQHPDSTVHTVTRQRLEDRMKAGRMMIAEARRYGYLAMFRPELEYSFTVLFYQNTLFSAMREWKGSGCRTFVTALAREMRETFPDFQQNLYYRARTDPEEKYYMGLQQRQPLRFYLQYKALWWYRDHRYRKRVPEKQEDK